MPIHVTKWADEQRELNVLQTVPIVCETTHVTCLCGRPVDLLLVNLSPRDSSIYSSIITLKVPVNDALTRALLESLNVDCAEGASVLPSSILNREVVADVLLPPEHSSAMPTVVGFRPAGDGV